MRKEKNPKDAGSLERVALRVCCWAETRMGTERVRRLMRPHRFWRPALHANPAVSHRAGGKPVHGSAMGAEPRRGKFNLGTVSSPTRGAELLRTPVPGEIADLLTCAKYFCPLAHLFRIAECTMSPALFISSNRVGVLSSERACLPSSRPSILHRTAGMSPVRLPVLGIRYPSL
jgi:hypothetical protein